MSRLSFRLSAPLRDLISEAPSRGLVTLGRSHQQLAPLPCYVLNGSSAVRCSVPGDCCLAVLLFKISTSSLFVSFPDSIRRLNSILCNLKSFVLYRSNGRGCKIYIPFSPPLSWRLAILGKMSRAAALTARASMSIPIHPKQQMSGSTRKAFPWCRSQLQTLSTH